MKIKKVLIIRFSSFGDIVQCSSVVDLIHREYPEAVIDWVTRSEFDYLVKLNHNINQVWSFNKKLGLQGLIKLGISLRALDYDHVYDAHNNLRSFMLSIIIRSKILKRPNWLVRPKDRLKRILLFSFRINLFPKPFKGIHSYRVPLMKWGVFPNEEEKLVTWNFKAELLEKIIPFLGDKKNIILVPSAAWEMKRWPLSLWKKLITIMPEYHFTVLGGKEDDFCEELREIEPSRVQNLAGKLSLVESCAIISRSQLVISGDTGLLHVADVMGVKALSLMGPTAFGFTTGKKITTMESNLSCRPCTKDGRGNCSQDIYQKCMVDITPSMVAREAMRLLLHE